MKRIVCMWVVLSYILVAGEAWAKRTRAPVVEPVVHEGIRFVAPNDNGRRAYVQAFDVATSNKTWELTVFKNRINPFLEADVQWVYIKSLRIENGDLIVTDEGNRQFTIDLEKHTVKRIKENKTAKQVPENIGTNAPNSQH